MVDSREVSDIKISSDFEGFCRDLRGESQGRATRQSNYIVIIRESG
jgi:hypothetical protein